MGVSELISYAGQWGSGDQEPFKEGAKLDLWQPNAALGTKLSVPSQSWQMRSGDGSQCEREGKLTMRETKEASRYQSQTRLN